MKEVERLPLKDFTRYCMSIAQVPSSYLSGLTMEEQLLWLCSFLTNEVIPTVNNNGEAVEELQQLYIQLKDYVDNYFDNLDIQEEVNTKLEEMAQSGELAELIAQYLEAQAVIGFNTCSGLAAAENLANGSFARTMGRNTYNDGYGAFYKIRTRINADVPDGYNIIELTETENLVAEKIPEHIQQELEIVKQDPINVKFNGVVGDGVTDDTTAIQDCIDNNPHKTIYFPEGTYLISEPLVIKEGNEYQVNLKLDDNAIIKTDTEIESLIEIAKDHEGTYDGYSAYGKMIIDGGVWDCENTTYGIYTTIRRLWTTIKNLTMINVENYGIYLDRVVDRAPSTNTRILNVNIYGKGSDINDNAVAIYMYGTDNELDEIRIQKIKKGIVSYGGDLISNVHITGAYSKENITAEEYDSSVGIEVFGKSFFSNIYVDTMGKSVVLNTNSYFNCSNFYVFYWKQNASFTTSVFKYNNIAYVCVDNCFLDLPSVGTVYGANISDISDTNNRRYLVYRKGLMVNHLRITNSASLNDFDKILSYQAQNKVNNVNVTYSPAWQVNMTVNTHYLVAGIRQGQYLLTIANNDDQVIEAKINASNSGSINVTNILNNAHSGQYTLYLVDSGVTVDGLTYYYLTISSNVANNKFSPSITIKNIFNNELFEYLGVKTIANPTIITSSSFNP